MLAAQCHSLRVCACLQVFRRLIPVSPADLRPYFVCARELVADVVVGAPSKHVMLCYIPPRRAKPHCPPPPLALPLTSHFFSYPLAHPLNNPPRDFHLESLSNSPLLSRPLLFFNNLKTFFRLFHPNFLFYILLRVPGCLAIFNRAALSRPLTLNSSLPCGYKMNKIR